ncbi:YciI family protein [Tessaracoccus sp. OS52]|uniref:YciI family protein n=1 Tax=Tessaracoccus sp. OS52 TaxID=2886691 RepID=UPI001D12505E|nr:YciI family protein [Tessaracoccus sp. OS52]
MNTYAVEYTYTEDSQALDEHRGAHREFLRALMPDPLVVAGAYQDGAPGALLVVRADAAAQVEELLDADPFHIQGLISDRRIRLWNPGIGQIG